MKVGTGIDSMSNRCSLWDISFRKETNIEIFVNRTVHQVSGVLVLSAGIIGEGDGRGSMHWFDAVWEMGEGPCIGLMLSGRWGRVHV